MKRFYTTITTAVLALVVSVVGVAKVHDVKPSVSEPLTIEKQVKKTDLKEVNPVQASNAFKGVKTPTTRQAALLEAKGMRKAAKAAPSTIVGKTYVVLFNDEDDDFSGSFSVAAGSSTGEVIFKGLANGLDVNGTYDAVTGKINIPVGVSLGSNGYGNVTLYSLDDQGYYSGTTPITATVSEDGIVFDNGLYSTFPYGGTTYYDALMLDIVAYEPNGTVSYSTSSKTVTAPIYVKKTDETTIQFYGVQPALLSAPFTTTNFNQAVSYEYELTLDEAALTATGEFQHVSNYGSYGDFYFGMIIGGYIDDPVFAVAVESNTSTLTAQNNAQGFIGYPNGGSYSGTYISNINITINMDVFNAPVSGDTGDPDDSDEGWEDAGTATLVDGWVLPAFGINQLDKENWFEVPLQKSTKNENIYRLVDPYHQEGFPALAKNTSKTVGYIVFDATDPDHVVVNIDQVEAGFANSSLGITKYYCYNTLAMYSLYFDYDPSFIVSVLGDDIAYTTFKDNVLSLGSYDDPEYGIQYDANFGYQTDKGGGYTWTDEDDETADMTAYVLLEGASLPGEYEEYEVIGTMSGYNDMSAGQSDEPELLDEPVEVELKGKYENGKLTITPMLDVNDAPVTFTINLETGDAVAENTLLDERDSMGDGTLLQYAYGDLASHEAKIVGKIYNTGEDSSELTLEPWGEMGDYTELGFGWYFEVVYYNTVAKLNFAIDGLIQKPEELPEEDPVITVGEVKWSALPNGEVNFEVPVSAEGLADDAVIKVYYTDPANDDSENEATFHPSGIYVFTLKGLDLATTYTTTVWAVAGNTESEEVEVEFTTYEPNPSIQMQWLDADYVTSTSATLYATASFNDMPDEGTLYAIASDKDKNFTKEVVLEDYQYGYEIEIELTGLTPETEYTFDVSIVLRDAEGETLVESTNGDWYAPASFTTLAAPAIPAVEITNVTTVADGSSVTFTVEYTATDIPDDAVRIVQVTDSESETREPVNVVYSEKDGDLVFTLDDLTDGEHNYMVALQYNDAEGNIIARSVKYVTVNVSGIVAVEVEAGDDARYFDLRGVEVSDPAAGQFYIRVEGASASKVLVK